MTVLLVIAHFIMGLILGSFTTAIVHRVKNKKSWIGDGNALARSACPHCNQQLSSKDLFPVLSWLFLKGRCRYCQTKISGKYPLTEVISGLCAVIIYLMFDVSLFALIVLLMLPFVLAQGLVFYENRFFSRQLFFIIGSLLFLGIISIIHNAIIY